MRVDFYAKFLKIMKKKTCFSIKESCFISVVIPSLNGSHAKLLVINKIEFKTLKKVAKLNINNAEKIFAFYAESNFSHQIYYDVIGCLTKEQFDMFLKERYNLNVQKSKKNIILKNVA